MTKWDLSRECKVGLTSENLCNIPLSVKDKNHKLFQ